MTGGWEGTSEPKVKVWFSCYMLLVLMHIYTIFLLWTRRVCLATWAYTFQIRKNPPVQKVQRHSELWLEEGNFWMLRMCGGWEREEWKSPVGGKSPLEYPSVSYSFTRRMPGYLDHFWLYLIIQEMPFLTHVCPGQNDLLGSLEKNQHVGCGFVLLLSSCCLQVPSTNGNTSSSFLPFDNCLSLG